MLDNAIEAVTHNGVKTMLALRFIQPGKLEREYGRIYQRLFDSRQAGNYEDFVYNDGETFAELRPLALRSIDAVSRMLGAGC